MRLLVVCHALLLANVEKNTLIFDKRAGGGPDGQSSGVLLLPSLPGGEGAARLELLPVGPLRAERQGAHASVHVVVCWPFCSVLFSRACSVLDVYAVTCQFGCSKRA